MIQDLQITIRDIPFSLSLENHIRQKVEKLVPRFNIIHCHVVVEVPQKHKHQGKLFNVKIDLTVPGKEIVVTRKPAEDVYISVRDSFNALERQLNNYTRIRKGHIKSHQPMMKGQISRILADQGFGFIEGQDGNEYYFSHTHVAHPAFDKLMVGDSVEYLVISLNDGRQAHHIIRE